MDEPNDVAPAKIVQQTFKKRKQKKKSKRRCKKKKKKTVLRLLRSRYLASLRPKLREARAVLLLFPSLYFRWTRFDQKNSVGTRTRREKTKLKGKFRFVTRFTLRYRYRCIIYVVRDVHIYKYLSFPLNDTYTMVSLHFMVYDHET